MIRRFLAMLLLAWALGFAWFALVLPQPMEPQRDDAVVVLTGGEGRIARGLEALEEGWAGELLVAGVDREVKPGEFAAEYKVSPSVMSCCVTLDRESVDTRSNAREAADWLATKEARSVRLVTSDWHMRRALRDLRRSVNEGTSVSPDAVRSKPSLRILFIEYHKLLARWIGDALGI